MRLVPPRKRFCQVRICQFESMLPYSPYRLTLPEPQNPKPPRPRHRAQSQLRRAEAPRHKSWNPGRPVLRFEVWRFSVESSRVIGFGSYRFFNRTFSAKNPGPLTNDIWLKGSKYGVPGFGCCVTLRFREGSSLKARVYLCNSSFNC